MQSLIDCGENIIYAMSAGDMTPDQATTVMSVLESQRKNIETSDLALRIAEMERVLKRRTKEKK